MRLHYWDLPAKSGLMKVRRGKRQQTVHNRQWILPDSKKTAAEASEHKYIIALDVT